MQFWFSGEAFNRILELNFFYIDIIHEFRQVVKGLKKLFMNTAEDNYSLWRNVVLPLRSSGVPAADNHTIRQAIVQEVVAKEAVDVLMIRLEPGEARGEVENG